MMVSFLYSAEGSVLVQLTDRVNFQETRNQLIMTQNTATTYQEPLPDQDIKLLRIFNYYRVALAFVLLISYVNEVSRTFVGATNPKLFVTTASLYLLVTLILIPVFYKTTQLQTRQILLNLLADITVLSLMTYASGGVSSGLGNLITFSVAAGSLLLHGRFATLCAAVASIAIISLEAYRSIVDLSPIPQHFQAGILGMLYFGTSFLIRGVSRRVSASEKLAQERAGNIQTLQKINQLIIQRMRTGVIVCTNNGTIRMTNHAASQLMDESDNLTPNQLLPGLLMKRFREWSHNPIKRPPPFQHRSGDREIQANFATFEKNEDSDVLLFIEDTSKTMQQAQQLKLASLGQLTANIAHEIRNPLGAISHASQLLSESENLDSADHRLSHIIQQNTLRLNKTIESVLQLSKRKSSNPETVPLKTWLNHFTANYHHDGKSKACFSINITPEDLEIQIDPTQFYQIINNLCSNGLRYSEAKTGVAAIEFKGGINPDSERPYLEVVDHGAGITAEVKPHLFEPFYTTERTGTGLGLHISRDLCEANYARLVHDEQIQNGCCFRIIFPHPKKLAY